MTPLAKPMPTSYQFDPADPRAPTEAEWAQMTPEERTQVVATLPVVVPEELMPLLARHQAAKAQVEAALEQARAAEQQVADLRRQLEAAHEEIERLRGR